MTDWNKPDSNEALKPWRLIDPLTLYQAVMLIFGRDPSHQSTGSPRGYVPIMAALRQAIERAEVTATRTNNSAEGKPFSLDHEHLAFVTQAEIRKWLETIDGPNAFFFLIAPNDWPQTTVSVPVVDAETKPLDARERTTLLLIVNALADAAEIDLTQHYKAGQAIEIMLNAKGVQLAARTIGEHLKAAREALETRKV